MAGEIPSDDPFATVSAVSVAAETIPAPDLQGVEGSEDAVARAIADRLDGRIAFNQDRGRWYKWDDLDGVWRMDATGEVRHAVRLGLRRASETEQGSKRAALRSARTAKGVETFLRDDPRCSCTSEDFDADPMLLACPGAVTIDLVSGQTRPSRPEDRITKLAGFAPEDGPCPLFHKFLQEAMAGDEEKIHFLQSLSGYALTGLTKEQILAIFFGSGGNGKSLFLNILRAVMGEYAVVAPMEMFMSSRGDRHPTDIASLAGARLVTATETTEGRSFDEAKIKQLTGGEPVSARFMGRDFFTYWPQYKIVVACNSQPVLRNVDDAMRRRLLILPWTHRPSRVDPDLEQKLLQEAPQILAWAVRGCLEWQSEGLPRPEAVLAATGEYFADQDLFSGWIDERVERGAEHFAPAADLYRSWQAFCETAGEKAGSAKSLGARLRRVGLISKLERVDGKPVKVWCGVRVRAGGSGHA
jgi:putative DNA primase/helicase